jgi:hypothetical protein
VPSSARSHAPARIPTWLKVGHTALATVVVLPYAWLLAPSNFLWFSDIALVLTAVALWRESRLLASMMALSTLLPELFWNLDFFARLLTSRPMLRLTDYMFDPHTPIAVRVLSLFHVPLPLVLLLALRRLGYDRRALPAQTLLAWVVLAASYLLTDSVKNINWVHGLRDARSPVFPQPFHVLAEALVLPLVVYLPTHLMLARVFRR